MPQSWRPRRAPHHPLGTMPRGRSRGTIPSVKRPRRGRDAVLAVLASDYPFMDIFWTMTIFFAWVIWIWLLIMVLADNFRRHDHSGFSKAMWTVFVIFLPLLGVLVYMVARPAEDPSLMARGTS